MNVSITMAKQRAIHCAAALGLATVLAACGGAASTVPAGDAEAGSSAVVAGSASKAGALPASSALNDAGGEVDACALASAEDATALLDSAAAAGQPSSQGSWICMWSANSRSVTLTVWTSARLEQEAQGYDAAAYYRQSSRLIGTPWQVEPEPVDGVGEQAVWAGKHVSELVGTQGQLAALSHDAYFQFTTIGPERDGVAAFAAHAVDKYAP